jgi:hypothetical protein
MAARYQRTSACVRGAEKALSDAFSTWNNRVLTADDEGRPAELTVSLTANAKGRHK